MLFIDNNNPSIIYDYDMNKTKIVKEYKNDLNKAFIDLSLDGSKT